MGSLRVLLTGATGFLGSHLLLEGIRRGHKIIAVVRSFKSLDKLDPEKRRSIEDLKDRVCYVEQDLIRDKNVSRLIENAYNCFKGIDAVINSAAMWDDTNPRIITYERWIEVLTLNLIIPYQIAIEASKYMRDGVIVNISCLSSLRGHKIYDPLKPSPAYIASKTALNAVTRYLAEILAEKDIIVVGVAPSWIEKPEIERYRRELERKLPLKRAAKPEEVSKVVYYLIEEKNPYLSGAIIEIPGAL
ncbi:MAG: SDR family oxidoreductase [Sulfolobales archaeon]